MMQDSETGETDFLSIGVRHSECGFDEETGEPDHLAPCPQQFRKRKFNVPKQYLTVDSKKITRQKCQIRCKQSYILTNKDKVIHLKEEIILGHNKTSHRLFLIPSLFFFTKLTAFLLGFIEISLHVWAHHKNSKNTNPNVYYRSPLHILSSQFCALCRSQNEYYHINRLQDRTRRLHENLKKVTSSFT